MNGFETILPFLKPIEHLILDDSISEVMVNGADRVFVEKAGFVEEYCSPLRRRYFGVQADS
jgi:Flp pilus assembly CpaF family ATPase